MFGKPSSCSCMRKIQSRDLEICFQSIIKCILAKMSVERRPKPYTGLTSVGQVLVLLISRRCVGPQLQLAIQHRDRRYLILYHWTVFTSKIAPLSSCLTLKVPMLQMAFEGLITSLGMTFGRDKKTLWRLNTLYLCTVPSWLLHMNNINVANVMCSLQGRPRLHNNI